jgi:nucleotide-binding universal stress UspA family protein
MIQKILVPLDGSDLARKALPYAEELAHRFEAELILVRVIQAMPVVVEYGVPVYEPDLAQLQQEAELYLDGLKGELRQLQIPAQTIVLADQPVPEAIINLASEKAADLIVMSTHGRSGLSRWVFGSVANKVLQRAACPVYLVRAHNHEKLSEGVPQSNGVAAH